MDVPTKPLSSLELRHLARLQAALHPPDPSLVLQSLLEHAQAQGLNPQDLYHLALQVSESNPEQPWPSYEHVAPARAPLKLPSVLAPRKRS